MFDQGLEESPSPVQSAGYCCFIGKSREMKVIWNRVSRSCVVLSEGLGEFAVLRPASGSDEWGHLVCGAVKACLGCPSEGSQFQFTK